MFWPFLLVYESFMHAWVSHMDLDRIWSPNIKWKRIPWACRWKGKHMGTKCVEHETRSPTHDKRSIDAKLLESIPPRFHNLGWFPPSYPFSLSLFQLANKAWINYCASLMCRLSLPLAQRGSFAFRVFILNNVFDIPIYAMFLLGLYFVFLLFYFTLSQ